MWTLPKEITFDIISRLDLRSQLALLEALANKELHQFVWKDVARLKKPRDINIIGDNTCKRTLCFLLAIHHYYDFDHKRNCPCELSPICDCGNLTEHVDMTNGKRGIRSNEVPMYDTFYCRQCDQYYISCRGCCLETLSGEGYGKVMKTARPLEGPIFEPPVYRNHTNFCKYLHHLPSFSNI